MPQRLDPAFTLASVPHHPMSLVTQLLSNLARLGVREFCVAAGARNAQIIAELQACKGIKLWNFFEERCAGFFALGRMLHDQAPVAVVTTSGTAAAELLPAMIEAHYQHLPLVAVTADRPPHYRGSGAPQAIEQAELFGMFARTRWDLADPADIVPLSSMQSISGPVHLNVCLEEGAEANAEGLDFEGLREARPAQRSESWTSDHDALVDFLRHDPLILAGGLHPAEAAALWDVLEKQHLPIIAEASANLHGHPCAIAGSEQLLTRLSVTHVLRLGGVPTWRWWRDLEGRPEVAVLNLTRSGYPGLARRENVATLPLLDRWPPPLPALRPLPTPFLPDAMAGSEQAWMETIAAAIPAGARVFLGNSLPIREFNHIRTPLARETFCYANRGANGIDGLVSTFLGLSATCAESWLIVGDLSALYDLAAPWVLPQLPRGNRRMVVINNGGGMIFSKVASLQSLPEPARAIIENRHTLGFAPWADLWNIPYRLVTDAEELRQLPDGAVLIEIKPVS